MKSLKYLNGVLTVIAVCLIILTISVIGAFPKANASSNTNHFVNSPLNKDRATNTMSPGDLIYFTQTDGKGLVYIRKSNVIDIVSVSDEQAQIYFTSGTFVNVHASAASIAFKINQ